MTIGVKALEEENARLKTLLADTLLDNFWLKDVSAMYAPSRPYKGHGQCPPPDRRLALAL